MSTNVDPHAPITWPNIAEGLYDFLTGRKATIEYHFEDLEIYVPSHSKDNEPGAKWKLNGKISLRTSEPNS